MVILSFLSCGFLCLGLLMIVVLIWLFMSELIVLFMGLLIRVLIVLKIMVVIRKVFCKGVSGVGLVRVVVVC